jgi:ABC-type transport system involved in multi-copper enzyme maturation permease subunit
MSSPIPALLRNEILKAVRRKLPWFGLAMVVLLCVLIHGVAGQLSVTATSNGWGYLAFSMQLVFTDLGLIFIMVFAAMLLAEETGTGTLRAALAAPVHRWELYLAKAITGLLYMFLLWSVALVCCAALARTSYPFGQVGDSFGVVYSRKVIVETFGLGALLSLLPLTALVAYGLFISTVVRTPGAAVAVAISTIYLSDFTKHLVHLDAWIFTKYINYSWIVLQQAAQGVDFQWQPEVWRMLALCGAYTLVLLGAGLMIFMREDLND